MKLTFSPTSLADLQRINQFYTLIDAKVARKAMVALTETIDLVLQFPLAGRSYLEKSHVREFVAPFGKGNFVIRYQFIKKQINVLHIWHNSEDE